MSASDFFILFIITFVILTPGFLLIRQIKAINFWLYLWQVKEYHVGRFLDHFRTNQGRKIILNPFLAFKITFLVVWIIITYAPVLDFETKDKMSLMLVIFGIPILAVIYLLEVLKILKDFLLKRVLTPVSTVKIIFLRGTIFAFIIFTIWRFSSYLIPILFIYDIFVPVIVSVAVLMFQPFAVLGRNRILAQARAKRQMMQNLKVVGITGSYGKTTTKEILSHILSVKFKVAKTKEHQNSEIGVSRAILDDLKLGHEIFVCEMGAYNKGGIKLLAGIAQPQIALLLGANEQHLATFGSMENLLSAEGGKELVDALSADGVAIFNGANAHARKLYETTTKKKVLCGAGGSLSAEDIKAEQEKITFRIVARGRGEVLIEVPLLGAHNAENVLLAVATALELGMTLEEIAQACKTIPQSAGAMTLKKGKGGLHIIDSSYSANPSGVLADLEYLKVWPGKKVVIMPSLIELGKASEEAHQEIGKKIGEVCDLAIITTQDHVQDIQQGAGEERNKIVYMGNWKQVVERVQAFCQAGDSVLLGGRVPAQIMQHLCLE